MECGEWQNVAIRYRCWKLSGVILAYKLARGLRGAKSAKELDAIPHVRQENTRLRDDPLEGIGRECCQRRGCGIEHQRRGRDSRDRQGLPALCRT